MPGELLGVCFFLERKTMNQKPELQVACGLGVASSCWKTPSAAECFNIAKTHHDVPGELAKIPQGLTTFVIWPRRWETIRDLMLAGV